jgi:PAS domain S-box-containing protein
MESQSVAVFILDRDHRVTFWNRACENLTGCAAGEMIGGAEVWRAFYREKRPTMADLVLDGALDRAGSLYAVQGKSRLTEGAAHGEGWFANLGGRNRYVILDAAPIYDAEGQVWAVVETLQDITDLKNAERLLNEREADLKKAQAIARLGNWRLDLTSGAMTGSDEFYRILGLEPGIPLDRDTFAGYLRPDQLKQRQAAWSAVLLGARYELELNIVGENLDVWVSERIEIVRDAAGNPQLALGTVQDVSERHALLKNLNLRQTQYQAVVDAAADGFWMTDLEGRILDVNEAYARRSGFSRDELLKCHAWDLDAEKDREQVIAEVLKVFDEGRGTYTSRHRAKDGSTWPVSISLSFWPAGEGRIFAFFNNAEAARSGDDQTP